jgi:hypothetical protein
MSPSLPKTYKAAVADKPGDKLEINDLPLQLPSVGQVLVKVKACGVCHSDHVALAGHFNAMLVHLFYRLVDPNRSSQSIELLAKYLKQECKMANGSRT